MSRFVLLASEPLLESGEVVVELPQATVPTLALELSLLLGGLTDAVRLSGSSGAGVLLTIGGGDRVDKAQVSREGTEMVCFELGTNQAEYLQAVLLRAYRDGMFDANHVHIEGAIGDEPFDLTLLFELFRDPMSADDAIKLMG